MITKEKEKAVGLSICWGRVLLCRRKRKNLIVSRAKVEIHEKL